MSPVCCSLNHRRAPGCVASIHAVFMVRLRKSEGLSKMMGWEESTRWLYPAPDNPSQVPNSITATHAIGDPDVRNLRHMISRHRPLESRRVAESNKTESSYITILSSHIRHQHLHHTGIARLVASTTLNPASIHVCAGRLSLEKVQSQSNEQTIYSFKELITIIPSASRSRFRPQSYSFTSILPFQHNHILSPESTHEPTAPDGGIVGTGLGMACMI